MAKSKKIKKKITKDIEDSFSSKLIERISSEETKYFFGTILFVLLLYSFSIFRPWLPFDERLYFTESLFPIPLTFNEISEIIDNFVKNYHVESTNTFFSNHLTLRTNPIAGYLTVIVSFLFKKNVLLYHFLQISIHLLNVGLVWIIFHKLITFFSKESEDKANLAVLVPSFFSALWGIHSASLEAVLLTTNWDTILTYSLCFLFILYEITPLTNNESFKPNAGALKGLLISLLFTSTMFLTEYGYTLPLIVFFIILCLSFKSTNKISESLKISTLRTIPYLAGLFLFIFMSMSNSESPLINLQSEVSQNSAAYVFLERNLWLVPQIFIHFVSLLAFPKALSIYQSNLVSIENNLFSPLSIIYTTIYLSLLILPAALFILYKNKKYSFMLPLYYAFYFSLIPFLHVIIPTYCLSADRYCYFPYFFLLLLVLPVFITKKVKSLNKKSLITIFSIVLTLMTLRSLIRIQEWNNPEKLYYSAIKIEKSPLYKGQKLSVFANYVGAIGKTEKMENLLDESLKELEKGFKKYKSKKNIEQPITLKEYGLDFASLEEKTAYAIATVKNDNFQAPPEETLKYFTPYIKENGSLISINQTDLYSEILIKQGKQEKAIEVLEKGLEHFPYSSNLIFSLSKLYLINGEYEKNIALLKKAEKYFPNKKATQRYLYSHYEKTGDITNQAKYAYLIGLREHSEKSYQTAAKLFLDKGQITPAYATLQKLSKLGSQSPLTYLLTSRYLELAGNKTKAFQMLVNAYSIMKTPGHEGDLNILKSVLVSLVNFSALSGNNDEAKKYLTELENLNNLSDLDKKYINELKSKIYS